MDRYHKFDELPKDLQLILKRNAVSIRDQLELLPVLKQIMLNPMRKGDIVWSSPRDSQLYNHLVVIFELVKNRFVEGKDKNVLISVNWMAAQTVTYCYHKNIREMINNYITYKAKNFLKTVDPNYNVNLFSFPQFLADYPEKAREISDYAIELFFKFQKNWLQYKIPKWLNIVDSLQKYVASELEISPGDYSFVAESIENEFLDANIRILTEYGIPSSGIQKILRYVGHKIRDLSEDEVVKFIKQNRKEIDSFLSVYEIEALDRCL